MGLCGKKFPATSKITTNLQQKKSRSKKVTIYLQDSRTAFDSKRRRRPGLVSASSVFPLVRLPTMIWTSPFIQTAPDSPKACQTPFNWISLSWRLSLIQTDIWTTQRSNPMNIPGSDKKIILCGLQFYWCSTLDSSSQFNCHDNSVAIFQILVNHLSIALPATSHQEKVKSLKTSHLCIRQNQISGIWVAHDFGFNLN